MNIIEKYLAAGISTLLFCIAVVLLLKNSSIISRLTDYVWKEKTEIQGADVVWYTGTEPFDKITYSDVIAHLAGMDEKIYIIIDGIRYSRVEGENLTLETEGYPPVKETYSVEYIYGTDGSLEGIIYIGGKDL